MSDKSEGFEEWLEEFDNCAPHLAWQYAKEAWNHQQKKIDDLERTLNILRTQNQELAEQAVVDTTIREKLLHENKVLREAVEFYATFTPHQFPEGYYEICIEEGMGGIINLGQ